MERIAAKYNHLERVMQTAGTRSRKTNQITGNKSWKFKFEKRAKEIGNKRDMKVNVRTIFLSFQSQPIG